MKPNPRIRARQRVIYGDTDQMGIVYYGNYLRYFEFARLEFFLAIGGNYGDLEAQGWSLPVIEVDARYLAPARFQDMLAIEIWISELKRASFQFGYAVYREGTPEAILCTGHTRHACVGSRGKAIPLPTPLRELLK